MHKENATKQDIENLAQMIAHGFEDTATKSDIRDLDRRIEGLEMKVSSYASRWTDDFSKLHDWLQSRDYTVTYSDGDPGLWGLDADLVCLSVIFTHQCVFCHQLGLARGLVGQR